VWNRCQTVLVSDAGAPFERDETPATDAVRQLKRALDIALEQTLALRKRALIADYIAGQRTGAYWGIMTEIGKYGRSDSIDCPPEKTRELAAIRTRLNHFSEREQCELVNWGYAISDAAVRRWVNPNLPPPTGLPYPDYGLDSGN
jgi:NTE family protein